MHTPVAPKARLLLGLTAHLQRELECAEEVALDEEGVPLASAECFLAIRLRKIDVGETNVPVRGVQPAAFQIHETPEGAEGRRFERGSDEVLVGRRLADRLKNCRVGDVLTINVTPFRVVGIIDHDGPFASEIWGDLERMTAALLRGGYNRVIARVKDGTDLAAVQAELESDKQTPCNVFSEREYLSNQTGMLSAGIFALVGFLAVIMGVAAVFTAVNTMQAALAARTREIGTTNWDTFTEIAFAFRITPTVLQTAVTYAVILGLIGGPWPAFPAARMQPTEALRRG